MRKPIGIIGWLALAALAAATAGAWALCLWGPAVGRNARNVEHLATFAIWTAILALALQRVLAMTWWTTFLASTAIAIASAGVGELLQFRMDGHTPEWRGFWWSSAGIGVGMLLASPVWVLTRRRDRAPTDAGRPPPPAALFR